MVERVDLSGTHLDTLNNLINAPEKTVIYLVVGLCAGVVTCGLFWELSCDWFKKRKHNNFKSLGTITSILLVVYIGALVTTSTNNLGPMLFGGILTLWLGLLQDSQKNKI